ncbi:MAG: hypothetical protein M3014_09190 [Chloroflexota bacterium]|nr:hypothetical protein [Chloroflexota bacterium]
MSVAEDIIREQITVTAEKYAMRVRISAFIYIVLYVLSVAIAVTVAWRLQFFVALAQRTNVETLTLAIIFILALYYLISTFKGFTGAIRMLWLNAPLTLSHSAESREKVERRKHSVLKIGGDPKSAYFDQSVRLEGKPNEPIKWEIADTYGKLGTLEVDGVKATYYPLRAGVNNSLFEFLASQLEDAMKKRDLDAQLQITEWSSIDADGASAYYSMVKAFQNLEGRLEGGPIWPTVEITQDDVDKIGKELRKLVPALRSECLLPDLEYEVEYTVPVMPEPLGFVQLSRNDNRADPVLSMGCAMFVMLAVMSILLFIIILPPWIPSK